MSKSSPARARYHAENYARRNASKLAAQAMHAAAVKAATSADTYPDGNAAAAALLREAFADLNRQAAASVAVFAELNETLAILADPDAMSAITEAEQENTA